MPKIILSLFLLSFLLAACALQPIPLPPTATLSISTKKPPLPTVTPQPTATVTILPATPTITMIPTVKSDNVEDLIQILYASDPDLSQYNPQSIPYAQFPDALEKLSAMRSKANDAASHIAKAISFPRQEAVLAAKTLLSYGPDITALAIPVLMDNLHSQNPKSRLYSVIVLGTVKELASCAVGDIGPLLWDTDPEVRFASAFALEKIAGKDLLPNNIIDSPDPLSIDALLADSPEGNFVQDARNWWTEEGYKINWDP
jgi:hypothetical protein